ncbi:hypothetical protein, partial [Escherichia coli]
LAERVLTEDGRADLARRTGDVDARSVERLRQLFGTDNEAVLRAALTDPLRPGTTDYAYAEELYQGRLGEDRAVTEQVEAARRDAYHA